MEVTVQFNVPYECKLAADWVREVNTKSFEENVHVFEVDVNTVAESRSETVQFCGNNTCIPFTITQEAAAFDYKLAIDTEKISVSAEGTQEPVAVNVNSNLPWSVVSDADWCTVSPESGENDGSFSIVAAVKDTEEKYDTYTGLGWNAELTGNNLKMDLSVYVKKAGEYKVTVLLIEDGVVGYQADYLNGNDRSYEHSGIIRGALSDVKGDQFTTEADGMVKHFTYSEFIPSDFDLENMRVMVYVQKKLDLKKSYYADNTASAPLGEDKTLGTVE